MFTIISRQAAHASGATHYFTGKPCAAGHTVPRYVSTGNCTQCQKERSASYASTLRKGRVARLQGHFAYPLHPDDFAAALAYCQALDLNRGNRPHIPSSASVLPPVTAQQIEEHRQAVFTGLRKPEPEPYLPKL